MRVVLQRVKKASVAIAEQTVGQINQGLMLLVGFQTGDGSEQIDHLVKAAANYAEFNQKLQALGLEVQTGEFGADMQVSLINDGPVTIIFDTENR